ncbi:uncharacterized protein ACBR49_005163 [Aulostomus maculatus]
MELKLIFVTLTKYLSPLCVVAGILLFAFQSPTVRMKMKMLSNTPSPAPFFKPLFQQHNGNLKDSEENLHFNSPLAMHLTLAQRQNPYVGLPLLHEASSLPVACPVDMSYMQLPCGVWGVGTGEGEEVCTPPKDFFDISHADSGCSCEDLSQSPECSLPNSPVNDNPPTCH